MAAAFNPYHKWLAIPLEEQPPHHYRLLGTKVFETDADVIESAADQRMAHLRTFQGGKHAALSQQLLNEISAAKGCLLEPQKRSEYDRWLHEALEARANHPAAGPAPTQAAIALPPRSDLPTPSPVAIVIPPQGLPSPTPLAIQTSRRRGRSFGSQSRTMAFAVTAFALAVALGGAIIWFNLPSREAAPVATASNSAPRAAPVTKQPVAKQPAAKPKPPPAPPPAIAVQSPAPTSAPPPASPPLEPPLSFAVPPAVVPAEVAALSDVEQPSATAAASPAQRGFLVANFKGELDVFLNGQRLALATNQQPLPVSLKPTDILVLRLSSPFVFRALRLAFVGDGGGSAVLFQRQNFRRIDELDVAHIKAADVAAATEQPSAASADDTRKKLWAELQLPADDSQWMCGPGKNTRFQYACVIGAEMFRPIDTTATLAYLRQTWPAETGLVATESSQPAGRANGFLQVCQRLQGKQNPTGLAASARPFQAPRGDGRRGANGFTISAADGWKTQGTRWRFHYSREGTAWGSRPSIRFKAATRWFLSMTTCSSSPAEIGTTAVGGRVPTRFR